MLNLQRWLWVFANYCVSLTGLLQQHNNVEHGCVASVYFYKFHIKYKNKLHNLEFDYNNTAQNILSFRQLYKNKREKIKKFAPFFGWYRNCFNCLTIQSIVLDSRKQL
jgi:hypothetical protein